MNLGAATTLVVIVTTVLWYFIKYVLRRNGYVAHLFWGHFGDIINLHSLIDKERNEKQRREYIILLVAFYTGFALTVTCFILMALLNQ